MVFSSGKHTRRFTHIVKTDVMLSPGTTSLGIINVGRGRLTPRTNLLEEHRAKTGEE
jgi:hypothetical protein